MKGKLVGYLVSAAFVVIVVIVAFRIPVVRGWILGTSSTPAA